MPINVYEQNQDVKDKFYKSINKTVDKRIEERSEEISDIYESFFGMGSFIKPFAKLGLNIKNSIDNAKGSVGEILVKVILTNSNNCLNRYYSGIINDVVIEIDNNEFIQLDHIIISENGIFLIETKNWNGAYQGYKDKWKVKGSTGWRECKSPTSQHKRHEVLFKKWFKNKIGNAQLLNAINSVVVINASWVRASNCSVEVAAGTFELIDYIEKFQRKIIEKDLINKIIEEIINAKPYGMETIVKDSSQTIRNAENIFIKEGVSKNGRKFIRIKGNKLEAEEVAKRYQTSGLKTSKVNEDINNNEFMYFYFE